MFVVFEGIDGSGKTTVSNLVVERLQAVGLSVKHLRAEGKFVSSVTEAIRALARDSKNVDLDPRAEFLLYVAREVQLIEEALRDALRSHDVVIADRFLYTAEVLARFGRGLSASYTRPVLEAAAGGITPDLVLLIDVDPVLARARRKASKLLVKDGKPPSRKGLSGVGLQHRLRRGYLELAAEAPERWFVASNEELLEDTVARVTGLIQRAVTHGAQRALKSAQAELAAREAPMTRGSLRSPADALDALTRWLRARAEREPQVAAYLLGGLFGREVDGLRRMLAQRVPAVVLSGLTGLSDEVSWELREQLCAQHPGAAARSLAGLSAADARGEALAGRLVDVVPADVLKARAGRDDEAAWALRTQLFETHPDAAMTSLAGVTSPAAEALRARWLASRGARIDHDYEVARVAARSVHGIESVEAWALRDLSWSAAPVASLASIAGLTSARSWELRTRMLRRAAKVVMEGLRRVQDARAWPLRWAVASETKEAIDSIAGLGDEEAWALRDAFMDVWPSTVVKTLEQLADGERGRALVTRQLENHASNVSLLKHAAAIALGAHCGLSDERGAVDA